MSSSPKRSLNLAHRKITRMVERIEEQKQHERRLHWDGCINERDLGGFHARDGKRTRTGALVRMENPGHLTEEGLQAMRAHGVTTLIDLRYPMEISRYPQLADAMKDLADAPLIVSIPLLEEATQPDDDAAFARSRDKWHVHVLDNRGDAMATVLRTIADAEPGGVAIHCAAGKDRTGIVAALLLDLASVSRDEIVADYALSEHWLLPRTEEWLTHMDDVQRANVHGLMATPPEYMHFALNHVDACHGGTEQYLRTIGLTDAEIATLRERMIE